MRARYWLIISGVTFLFLALLSNLYHLQITKTDFYKAKAAAQAGNGAQPPRRTIYFTDKFDKAIPAALNKEYPVIFAVPTEVPDPEEAATQLSAIIGRPADELKPLLSKPNDTYELLLPKASEAQAAAAQNAHIKGVYVDRQDFRFYPFGSLAAHVLGFISPGDQDSLIAGRYGIERQFGEKLAADDVFLTINRNIQARAEEILKAVAEKYGATGGTVIVQNPKTGAILAFGNYPIFDPNEYSKSPVSSYLNPGVELRYEPGSVFKVITMAAGIDAGKITPDTKYYDKGLVTIDGRTISNWDLEKVGAYGWTTMTEVIEHSINTGAIFAEQKTGHDSFYNYLLKFGFNDLTGITLPGELIGNFRNLRTSFRDVNFATASFGQGLAVTPLTLISGLSAIANGGILMKPFIVKGIAPEEVRRVISEDAAAQVTAMMVSAVEKGKVAAIPNYRVAGKTGTAYIADGRGGYSHEVVNTYVGFAPASDPAFTILYKLDKPKGAPVAALTVVPAFHDLAQFILNYYNIAPDNVK